MDWSRSFADLDPPLEQQDGPVPIAPIAYSDDCMETDNLFRIILFNLISIWQIAQQWVTSDLWLS